MHAEEEEEIVHSELEQAQIDQEDQAIEESIYLNKHQPLTTLDIVSTRVTLPPFLFQDFMLSHSLTMISGEPYSSKTFLLLHILLSLETQTPLFGKYLSTSRQRCLFIGKDSPGWDYETQIKKLAAALPAPARELVQQRGNSVFFFRKPWLLTDPGFVDFLIETIRLFDITVVMFDTLLRFHSLDENSNRDMSLVLGLLERIRKEGNCSVIFTHHTAKPGENIRSANYQARGASVIPGAIDQHIHLRIANDRIALSCPKMRGGDGKPIKFSYRLVSRDNGIFIELNETDSLADQILAKLADGDLSREDLFGSIQPLYPSLPELDLRARFGGVISAMSRYKKIKKLESGLWTLAS